MRNLVIFFNAIGVIILVVVTISSNKYNNVSIILFALFIIIQFLIRPIVERWFSNRLTHIDGVVSEVVETGFSGKKIVTIKFDFEGSPYRIYKTFSDDEVPAAGSKRLIFINTKDIENSFDAQPRKDANNIISNILISILALAILLYKYYMS